MAIYLRAVKWEHLKQSEDSITKNRQKCFDAIVKIYGSKEQQMLLHEYILSPNIDEGNNSQQFVIVDASSSINITIIQCIRDSPIQKNIKIQLKQWIQKHNGTKTQIFQKQIKIEEFVIFFEYKYNQFLQLSGQSQFKVFRKIFTQLENIETSRPQQSQIKESQTKSIDFYQGSCKNKNLFSCLDPSAYSGNQKQFTIIQQPYI